MNLAFLSKPSQSYVDCDELVCGIAKSCVHVYVRFVERPVDTGLALRVLRFNLHVCVCVRTHRTPAVFVSTLP